MSRRLPGHARFYRLRWSAWFNAQFAPFNQGDKGRRRLVAALEQHPPCGLPSVRLSPSRVTSWLTGERVPDAKTAYRVGSALRTLGAQTHGAVALLAAGHLVSTMRFVRECALVDPNIAIALVTELPLLLGEFDDVGVDPIEYLSRDGWRTEQRAIATPEPLASDVAEMLDRRADDVDVAFEESLQRGRHFPRRLKDARSASVLDLRTAQEAADFALYRAWVVATGAIATVEALLPDSEPREIEPRAFALLNEFVYYLTHSARALSPRKGR